MRLIWLLVILFAPVALAQAPSVIVAPVERRALELTQPLVANVMPVTRTTVAAEQDGIVEKRMFDEGQRVRKGDLLASLNVDLLTIERAAADAARNMAAGELAQAKAELENANRESERQKELFETRVAPEKEFRDAITRRDIVTAMVATRTASLAEKSAMLDRLDTMLHKAEVKAPFDGVIASRHVEVGQWIKQGDAVADLLQLDPLFVEINVPEEVITRIRKGDEARVEIDAMGGKFFTGKIDQVLPQADRATRTFRVKILLPNSELAIWPGFFARAVLTSTSEDSVFIVPHDAVVTNGPQAHVVAVRDGKAAIVPVTLGRTTATGIQVNGELKDGDVVVIRGNEPLRGGEVVTVQNAATQPGASANVNGGPPAR